MSFIDCLNRRYQSQSKKTSCLICFKIPFSVDIQVTKRQIVRLYEENGEILITNKKVQHKIALNAMLKLSNNKIHAESQFSSDFSFLGYSYAVTEIVTSND